MIVIDSSALLAIFIGENEAERIAACIEDADSAVMSAATLVEASIVLNGTRFALMNGDMWLDQLIISERILIEPVTAEQAQIARAAYAEFGKGTGHPAQLNFGDCFAYALAKAMDVPLLFKGDDFSKTDIRSAF